MRCGEYNVKSESPVYQAQESDVAEIYYHPQYQPRTVKNNLAVLRTKENFIYQEHVSPVCLPRSYSTSSLTLSSTIYSTLSLVSLSSSLQYITCSRPNEEFQAQKGQECWSSGWGSDSFMESVSLVVTNYLVFKYGWNSWTE